ncbi:MAG TPA: nitroreductase family protein [Bacillota bacterium]|nr:nitroreductase family protein [Bacillota bacterium]
MDLKQVFEERRSVNFFKPAPIPEDVLRNIIQLATLVPSAFNLQPWEIIAVKSTAAKARLFQLASNQPKIKEAPVTLIIIGDLSGYKPENPAWDELETMLNNKKALEEYQQYAQEIYGSTKARKIKFAESNATLLAMSLMYAAKYYGVDTHPMSGIDFDGIKEEFGLAENKTVVMLIALGYFDDSKTLYPRRKRKGYDDIVKEV